MRSYSMDKLSKWATKLNLPLHEFTAVISALLTLYSAGATAVIVAAFLVYEVVEAKEIHNKTIDQAHKDIREFLVFLVATYTVLLALWIAKVI